MNKLARYKQSLIQQAVGHLIIRGLKRDSKEFIEQMITVKKDIEQIKSVPYYWKG